MTYPNAYIRTDPATQKKRITFLPDSNDTQTLDHIKPVFLTDEEIQAVVDKNEDKIKDILLR